MVVFVKARNSLVFQCREERVKWKKKTKKKTAAITTTATKNPEDCENLVSEAFSFLASKCN